MGECVFTLLLVYIEKAGVCSFNRNGSLTFGICVCIRDVILSSSPLQEECRVRDDTDGEANLLICLP